jgi:hypothetical protein
MFYYTKIIVLKGQKMKKREVINYVPKKLDIDDVIDDFISILDFDQILVWANILDVEINYPPIDDMWPDWQNELAVEVGDAMRKVGEKT